ncbi:MAG TPA: hypothetical protein VF472_17415 [Burkholderiaceae bacterium]
MTLLSRASRFRRAHVSRQPGAGAVQKGVLLIEALCAILIFSFGVLGLIGLQASTINQSSDAKYRTAAAELADKLVNQMWVSDRTYTTYATVFNPLFVSGGTVYTAWLGDASKPGTVMGTLPGVTATANLPTVSIGGPSANCATKGTCTETVTVTVNWQDPKDVSTGTVHSYVLNAQVNLY